MQEQMLAHPQLAYDPSSSVSGLVPMIFGVSIGEKARMHIHSRAMAVHPCSYNEELSNMGVSSIDSNLYG